MNASYCVSASCVPNCIECIGPLAYNCIKCDTGYYNIYTFDRCYQCPDGCEECSYITAELKVSCSTCKDGYYYTLDGTIGRCKCIIISRMLSIMQYYTGLMNDEYSECDLLEKENVHTIDGGSCNCETLYEFDSDLEVCYNPC